MDFTGIKRILLFILLAFLAACSKDDAPVTPEPDHFRPANSSSSAYISQVFEYLPAPGQFVNDGSTGTPDGAKAIIGGSDGLLSLGAYGGYVIFGFDHSIENKEGNDIGLYGNPLTNPGQEWSEPGIVLVMQDKNGNGEYVKSTTIKQYRITYYNPKKEEAADVLWKDNLGRSGYVLANYFHTQPYYPSFASNLDSITFEGTLLTNTIQKKFDPVYQTDLVTNLPFSWGYADSGSPELLDAIDKEGRGYNGLDISKAVDSKGNTITLKYIDFIKVYTGQNSNGDLSGDPDNPDRWLGEISTEISGAADLHIKK
jgi:hypothetical protein